MKELTLEQQRKLFYVISPNNTPVLTVDPKETIVVETEDAYSGQILKNGDKRDFEKVPYANPISGPIYVEDAEPGDTLAVSIVDIQPTIDQGVLRIPSWWWYLNDTHAIRTLSSFLNARPPDPCSICSIRKGKVWFGEISVPFKPMIGTIGTAPEVESILSVLPGQHGGNMDIPDICIGNTILLSVKVRGGLLHIGDVHSIQGEGELCGAGVDMPAKVTLTIDLIKEETIYWPRIKSQDTIGVISCSGVGRNLEDAVRIACIETVFWLENEYGLDRYHSFQLLSLVGQIQLGNIWTCAVKYPLKYLNLKT